MGHKFVCVQKKFKILKDFKGKAISSHLIVKVDRFDIL